MGPQDSAAFLKGWAYSEAHWIQLYILSMDIREILGLATQFDERVVFNRQYLYQELNTLLSEQCSTENFNGIR